MRMRRLLAPIVLMSLCATAHAQAKLMLYGGADHDVYLGCLNCSDTDAESVQNESGRYGSEISAQSIFNETGRYGSRLSPESPCNPFANDPPVIVDQNSSFYGYLTLNAAHRKAVTDGRTLNWLTYKVCKKDDEDDE
ncbi:hypothetical protein BVER_05052 [Candidatus Burkholderia verschuerenii]|uniref:Uncharacterized protein n=2 Tax=Candidatus Burkholderia verschuerenii TaxID=242163 RepID=A0A0L0MD11_9BURK|nr:hypothetical protein BVER_05052 [Candidatus Burkholderia verschuerenii]